MANSLPLFVAVLLGLILHFARLSVRPSVRRASVPLELESKKA